jgi:Arylsulfatase A and related enzymes
MTRATATVVPRQPDPQDAEPRPAARRGRALHRLPRQPDLLADALGPDDRRHEFKNGVTHTILERERLTLKATTVAQVLKSAGYTTGIFGKWHLGDEPDHWPDKRGFDEMFIHGCGGIGQSYPGSCGDVPGNTTSTRHPAQRQVREDQGLLHRRLLRPGPCWMESVKGKKPFFCYIPTNAPHAPLHVRPED